MKIILSSILLIFALDLCQGGPLRLHKRAASFYIANDTACVVDSTVYLSGDPIPTDDPCEACRCRPPGFACVLKECETKPGCRAVRRTGHCCPDYICGCEHNGRMYRDGDEIRDSQNPCYTCHCQGSSIACAFVDCFFRVDCAPEYVPGECCPHYNHCSIVDTDNASTKSPLITENEYRHEVSTTQLPIFEDDSKNSSEENSGEDTRTSEEEQPENEESEHLLPTTDSSDLSKDEQSFKPEVNTLGSLSNDAEGSTTSAEDNDKTSEENDATTESQKVEFEILLFRVLNGSCILVLSNLFNVNILLNNVSSFTYLMYLSTYQKTAWKQIENFCSHADIPLSSQ